MSTDRIPLIKPYVTFDEVQSQFEDIFESGWFTKGRNVAGFREDISAYTGARYSFTTTSATTALYACLKVLGIGTGDEVIVSDFSFPATANVVEDAGAIPIFADVSLETYNMTAAELRTKISPKTKAVIFVDAFGNPSGLDEIKVICTEHGLPLIEDAACAIGSSLDGAKCGKISDLSCFSFHPRKLLNCGEGGAITTDNPEYAEKLEILLNHGARIADGQFDFVESGYNFRMTEIQAAMGIAQLKKLDNIVSSRNEIKNSYDEKLVPLGFIPQKINKNVITNCQSLVYRVPEGCDRDALVSALAARNIESTIGTYCLSGLTYYREKYDSVNPDSEKLQQTTITLPCYGGVDALFVAQNVADIINS